jgi:hypothetical protein
MRPASIPIKRQPSIFTTSGPVRKGRESGPAVHESVQSKTEQGTRESARTNQDRSDQSRFQYCTRLLFTGRLHRLTSQTSGNLK